MRLLDTESLRLVSFQDQYQIPHYAILSHTWGLPEEEISFHDLKDVNSLLKTVRNVGSSAKRTGWSKIEGACEKARSRGLRYLWIDTCCIDKSSSAELQEAINSMFQWYECSDTCFAYLADVSAVDDPTIQTSGFRRSRWFTRGWTLQELLAARDIVFYDHQWKDIGTKRSLQHIISDITGIKSEYIISPRDSTIVGIPISAYERLSDASVAEKMSWVASRQTTRIEDMAYCLLGLFNIHMPMLYGEGVNAFKRLQEEIMKTTDDCSLLCWGFQEPHDTRIYGHSALLALRPSSFRFCDDVAPKRIPGFALPSFSITQRGLSMNLPVVTDQTYPTVVYGILACAPSIRCIDERPSTEYFLAIPLISAVACNTKYATSERERLGFQEGEYLRPYFCRPKLVSSEFVKRAEWKPFVILRRSENFNNLHELPFGLTLPTNRRSLAVRILETYPPQDLDRTSVLTVAFVPVNPSVVK